MYIVELCDAREQVRFTAVAVEISDALQEAHVLMEDFESSEMDACVIKANEIPIASWVYTDDLWRFCRE